MKITLGHIFSTILIIVGIYLSLIWFIIPISTTTDNLGVLGAFGALITMTVFTFIIGFIITILQKNWNRGFNINLKFNKNKE